jgi:hypothetical protein
MSSGANKAGAIPRESQCGHAPVFQSSTTEWVGGGETNKIILGVLNLLNLCRCVIAQLADKN